MKTIKKGIKGTLIAVGLIAFWSVIAVLVIVEFLLPILKAAAVFKWLFT